MQQCNNSIENVIKHSVSQSVSSFFGGLAFSALSHYSNNALEDHRRCNLECVPLLTTFYNVSSCIYSSKSVSPGIV